MTSMYTLDVTDMQPLNQQSRLTSFVRLRTHVSTHLHCEVSLGNQQSHEFATPALLRDHTAMREPSHQMCFEARDGLALV